MSHGECRGGGVHGSWRMEGVKGGVPCRTESAEGGCMDHGAWRVCGRQCERHTVFAPTCDATPLSQRFRHAIKLDAACWL